jgi:hypothetical protein
MPTLPSVRTNSPSDTAGAGGSGDAINTICVISPCAGVALADVVATRYGNAGAVFDDVGYCEGVEYVALHVAKTGRPVIFVGIPIASPGKVSRIDMSGNTGTAVASVAAGADGVLTEHGGAVRVKRGGVVGTDQILLEVSLDDQTTWRPLRLGTSTQYGNPYVGVTLNITAGTLVDNDVIVTWQGSAPRADSQGYAKARTVLTAGFDFFRSALLCGDLQTEAEAIALLGEANTYDDQSHRFIQVRASVRDRLPLAKMSRIKVRMAAGTSVTFAEVGASGDTITRTVGSWIDEGFQVGDFIQISGTSSNNVSALILTVSATVIALDSASDLANEGPITSAVIIGGPKITFVEVGATGDQITRSRGSWLDDGFKPGMTIAITGTTLNDVTGAIAGVTDSTITLGSTDLQLQATPSYAASITASETKAHWRSDIDGEFEAVNGFRLNLSAGRRRVSSPFTQWAFRRPAGWLASVREYSPGDRLHVTTWRPSDGPLAVLSDKTGQEWDDRDDLDGGAMTAGRFTSYRSWNNDTGVYISRDLTRAADGSLLTDECNANVVNLALTITQRATTQAAVGVSLVLDPDTGKATKDSLATVSTKVNAALAGALLKNNGEGPRCSSVLWTPNPDDVYNVADTVMHGTLDVEFNGIVVSVETETVIRSGG